MDKNLKVIIADMEKRCLTEKLNILATGIPSH